MYCPYFLLHTHVERLFLSLGDVKLLQFFQVGEQVLSYKPPELMLGSGGREVSSLVVCAWALCTVMPDAQMG
jgi:hypothetical protein